MTPFAIRVHSDRDSATVVMAGELDISTVGPVRECLDGLLRAEPLPERLVVDLERLSFVDSMGLSVLLETQRRATRRGIEVRFRSPSPHVRAVLDVTGLSRVFGLEAEPSASR